MRLKSVNKNSLSWTLHIVEVLLDDHWSALRKRLMFSFYITLQMLSTAGNGYIEAAELDELMSTMLKENHKVKTTWVSLKSYGQDNFLRQEMNAK